MIWFLFLVAALIPFKIRFLKPFATEDVAILILGTFMVLARKIDWKAFFWGPETRYLTCYGAVLLLSAVFSPSPATLQQVVEPFIAMSLLPLLVSAPFEKEIIKKVLFIVICVSLFESIVGGLQFISQHHVGFKNLGEVKFIKSANPASFFIEDGKRQIFRAYGTLIHPNLLGGFLTFSIFATYLLFLRAKYRWPFVVALALQLVGLSLTFSRAAILGWIVGSIICFSLLWKEEGIKPLLCILVGFMVAALIALYPYLAARGGIVSYNATSFYSDLGRWVYQKEALSLIASHPLLGVGAGSYLHYFPMYVHNIFLFIAAETGLLGLGVFLLFLMKAIKRGWEAKNNPESAILLGMIAALLVIGMCDFYLWVHVPGRVMLFLGLGLLIVARNDAKVPILIRTPV